MLKKMIFCFLFCSHLSIFSDDIALSRIIDLSKLTPSYNAYDDLDQEAYLLGFYAFNTAPDLASVFMYFKKKYNIDVGIETGTFYGSTTACLSLIFDQVHTIEISNYQYNAAKRRLQNLQNVECHLGSSEHVLQQILPTLIDNRIIFYLDAHWNAYWPLLDELETISKTHKDNCIIVIDDFKVPGRNDIAYDALGSDECSYEYIKEKLSKVYSGYTYHYLIPKNSFCRAKFIAIPNKWQNNNS
jgi:hypothetical protein